MKIYTNNKKEAQLPRLKDYKLHGYIQHSTNGRVSRIVDISPVDYKGRSDCRNIKFMIKSVGYFDRDLVFVSTPSPQVNEAHIKWWDPVDLVMFKVDE
jgi:hypothetical protein